jgi:hypothetical protein
MAWTNALIAMTILFAGKHTAPLALNNAGFQFLFVALYGACDEQEFKMEPTPPSWPLRALAYKSKETQFLKLFSDDVKLEFLFLVLHHEDDQNWHIATYLFALSTSPQSNSRMTIFIRQLLKIGAMHACSNHKATSKHLRLGDRLRAELDMYLWLWAGKDAPAARFPTAPASNPIQSLPETHPGNHPENQ